MFANLIILKKSVFSLFPRILLTVSNCIAHPSNPNLTHEVGTWPNDYCIHYFYTTSILETKKLRFFIVHTVFLLTARNNLTLMITSFT